MQSIRSSPARATPISTISRWLFRLSGSRLEASPPVISPSRTARSPSPAPRWATRCLRSLPCRSMQTALMSRRRPRPLPPPSRLSLSTGATCRLDPAPTEPVCSRRNLRPARTPRRRPIDSRLMPLLLSRPLRQPSLSLTVCILTSAQPSAISSRPQCRRRLPLSSLMNSVSPAHRSQGQCKACWATKMTAVKTSAACSPAPTRSAPRASTNMPMVPVS